MDDNVGPVACAEAVIEMGLAAGHSGNCTAFAAPSVVALGAAQAEVAPSLGVMPGYLGCLGARAPEEGLRSLDAGYAMHVFLLFFSLTEVYFLRVLILVKRVGAQKHTQSVKRPAWSAGQDLPHP